MLVARAGARHLRMQRLEQTHIAMFDAGSFGIGYVKCVGPYVWRVWLPEATSSDRLPADLQKQLEGAYEPDPFTWRAAQALEECYMKGTCAGNIPHRLEGVTPFQRDVLEACLRIAPGHTTSYAGLARAAGHPRAIRAVGSVMAMNPLPLIIPCHRVVRSDGSVGSYGGGSAMKAHLLEMERTQAGNGLAARALNGRH